MAHLVYEGAEGSSGKEAVSDVCPERTLLEVLAREAIVVDPADVTEYQARLKQLAGSVKPEVPSVELEKALRVEMHAYRGIAEKKVTQLRMDLASTADAMQEYLTELTGQDQSQEKKLRTDLDRLSALRQVRSLEHLHAGIDSVRASIQSTIEQIKNQNQAIVTQLRDEIRTLHKRLEHTDRRRVQTGTLVNRANFEQRIRAKVASREIFSLYLVRVTNWKELLDYHDQEAVQTLLGNITSRLGAVIGPDTYSGRWYDGYFVAVVSMDKRAAMERASELTQELSGKYGTGYGSAEIRTRVAVVDYVPGQDADQMLRRVEQLILAFEG